MKDSINFLDHINGKKRENNTQYEYVCHHEYTMLVNMLCYCVSSDQRNMGMSMRVEQSTLEQVKKRFEIVKKRKEEDKKKYGKL